jgi:GNAT superfamily N-acetyltransferase
VEPIPIAERQIGAAANVFARAFANDPASTRVFPDPASRERMLRACGAWVLRFAFLFAEALVTPGSVDAVMVLRRSHVEYTDERLRASGFEDLPGLLGDECWARFTSELMRIVEHAEATLHEAVDPSSWYLDQLAVDPSQQGRGVGGGLVEWLNGQADATGASVCLVTYQPRNVPFYARYGYVVGAEGREPRSGVRYWCFERKPSTTAHRPC